MCKTTFRCSAFFFRSTSESREAFSCTKWKITDLHPFPSSSHHLSSLQGYLDCARISRAGAAVVEIFLATCNCVGFCEAEWKLFPSFTMFSCFSCNRKSLNWKFRFSRRGKLFALFSFSRENSGKSSNEALSKLRCIYAFLENKNSKKKKFLEAFHSIRREILENWPTHEQRKFVA